MCTYTKVQNQTKQKKNGDLTPRCWFVRVIQVFRPENLREISWKKSRVENAVLCGVHRSKKKPWAIQFNQKMPLYKDRCYSWTELINDNSKIAHTVVIYLTCSSMSFSFLSWPFRFCHFWYKTSHLEILSVHDLLKHLATAGENTQKESFPPEEF